VLLDAHASDEKFRERLLREARLLSALDHPHIVHVDDLGMEGALVYLVLPYLSGGTLQDHLHAQTGPLPLVEVQRALEQICAALDYAHRRKVVHLDLKPANVLVHEEGRLLLSDFGLAHLLAQGAVAGGTSLHFGSPLYMAPEQFEGKPTPQSDLYALGVILYQLLVGRPPFEASTPAALMRQHLLEPPPRLSATRPDLPAGVETVLERALAKQPDQRYAHAEDLLVDFQARLSGQAVPPLPGVVLGSADIARPSPTRLTPTGPATRLAGTGARASALAPGQAASPSPLLRPQTRRCAHCGAETPLPMRFCGACGRSLDALPWGAVGLPAPSVAQPPGMRPAAGALPVFQKRTNRLRSARAMLIALLLALVVVGTAVLLALKPFSHAAPSVPPGTITLFQVPLHEVVGLAAGPDGNLWFLESLTNQIGRLTPSGRITEYALPPSVRLAPATTCITAGPDGSVWFALDGPYLGRIAKSGTVTVVPLSGDVELCGALTTGPDGNLWATGVTANASSALLRISPRGAVTAFPISANSFAPLPEAITTGPDGNLWFTYAGGIGRMTLSDEVTVFPLPHPQNNLDAIIRGPNGNLWFTDEGPNHAPSYVGKITTSGAITEFPLPQGSGAGGIAAGPDGNLWFTDDGSYQIGRLTPRGALTEFPIPTPGDIQRGLSTIVAGLDGNLWFLDRDNEQIGRITP
jgi:streptogramin lyase